MTGKHWRKQHTHDFGPWPHPWEHRRRSLFLRFAVAFGLIGLLCLGGMAALAFLFTQWLGNGRQAVLLVWIGGVALSLGLPLLAIWLAIRAFRGIATPLADIMVAADRVAGGDFTARVSVPPYYRPGEFRRLAESFNRMTEELERADRQRRNLTADVAHELRTPLHIIQGTLEGILDGVYEPTEEHVRTTLDETRLLARLVEDLRTLSLAEAGQLPLVIEPLDVSDLLGDVETSFGPQAEAAGVALRVEIAAGSESLAINGDVGRLEQVLGNLMGNALRHTPAGGTITLRAEPASPGVRLVVSDTGEGIPPKDLPYIFDRFWRGDRARSHARGAGSGLGLAIARQLVQAHGGSIQVDSPPGQGTTFTILLPAGPARPAG